jgi:uncharacterized protein YbbC (DUF1343 family)
MTVGELGRLFVEEFGIQCDLEVVPMVGWERGDWMDETDAPWILPSPNMPTLETATVFPGTVHLEGTQISEGRGTTRPFELIGAPYINSEQLAKYLQGLNLPGVHFRPCGFRPTFQKHAEEICGGVQIHVTDRKSFTPVITGVAIVKAIYALYPEDFRWKNPPYEYVFDKNPFDVVAGTDLIRSQIEEHVSLTQIQESWSVPMDDFKKLRNEFLIY